MDKLSEVYKHDGETLSRLNAAYWYLRDGDLRPEKLSKFMNGKGITSFAQLDMLDETCNLFTTKEQALTASAVVRACLGALRHRMYP